MCCIFQRQQQQQPGHGQGTPMVPQVGPQHSQTQQWLQQQQLRQQLHSQQNQQMPNMQQQFQQPQPPPPGYPTDQQRARMNFQPQQQPSFPGKLQ